MRILYVTDAWHGFREAVFEGSSEMNGLPSFNLVLKKLIREGNSVDFAMVQNRYPDSKLNIGVDWLSEPQFKYIQYLGKGNKFIDYFKFIWNVNKIIKSGNYDFVYAHGVTTGLSIFSSKLYKVPFGQRVYGTFLWDEYKKSGKQTIFYKHFNQYLTYRLKKSFLLVTNDGSKGDKVYKIINKDQKSDFYFWTNGVNREYINQVLDEYTNTPSQKFIFYPARIDRWKRQDNVIRILAELKNKGIDLFCIFAGSIETGNEQYLNELKELANELGVANQIDFVGNKNLNQIIKFHRDAIATLSLYDVCNFTNVFHEMMASGAVAIVKKDGVTDTIIDHGIDGFLVESNDDVVKILMNIIDLDNSRIREKAIIKSKKYIKNWDERIDDEIDLIKNAVIKY